MNLIRLVVANEQNDGSITITAEALVDALCDISGFLFYLAIERKRTSCRSGDLEQDEASNPLGMTLQKNLDRSKTIRDTFGEIETLDTNCQQRRLWKPIP